MANERLGKAASLPTRTIPFTDEEIEHVQQLVLEYVPGHERDIMAMLGVTPGDVQINDFMD